LQEVDRDAGFREIAGEEVPAGEDGVFTVRLTGMVWGELPAPALAIVIVAKYVPAEIPEVL
jgi:hypothetical protein